jgi:hypothetical protein
MAPVAALKKSESVCCLPDALLAVPAALPRGRGAAAAAVKVAATPLLLAALLLPPPQLLFLCLSTSSWLTNFRMYCSCCRL